MKLVGFKQNQFDLKNKNHWYLLLTVLTVIAVFIFYSNQDATIEIKNKSINIHGMYGIEIPFTSIESIDSIQSMPHIGFKSNGYSFGSVNKGYFHVTDMGNALLFVTTNSSPIIKIRMRTGNFVFINYSNRDETVRLYKTIAHQFIQ
ncbi:PH domain-containing protein [Arcticibacter eurypsychrophilus]|uniref:PH domain-containing protein n=1 Tax=Arcticibacter eurypsychrophilus TaxID=1434752 RepID=UPI00084DC8A4|nr:PH domain-containing protein [Arcticibacter eurypsychrophilus]